MTPEDPFVFPKAFVCCSKGLCFKREGVQGNAISLFLFVGSCGSRGGICNLLSCLRRSENWWRSKVIFSLSLSLSLSLRFLLFWMCVCVDFRGHPTINFFPASPFILLLSYSWFLPPPGGFRYWLTALLFYLHGRMWRLWWTLVETGSFTTPSPTLRFRRTQNMPSLTISLYVSVL